MTQAMTQATQDDTQIADAVNEDELLDNRGLARLVLLGHAASSFMWAWRGSSMVRTFDVLRTYRHLSVTLMFLQRVMPTCVDVATENVHLATGSSLTTLPCAPFT